MRIKLFYVNKRDHEEMPRYRVTNQIHISKASSLLLSACVNVHVSTASVSYSKQDTLYSFIQFQIYTEEQIMMTAVKYQRLYNAFT